MKAERYTLENKPFTIHPVVARKRTKKGLLASLAVPKKEVVEFAEALSRVHSHLIVLAAGQDAILRALRNRGSRG